MNELKITKAKANDLIWIYQEIGKNAQAGHIHSVYLDEVQRMGVLSQVAMRNELRLLIQRDANETSMILTADLWVATVREEPAGFLLTLFDGSRNHPTSIELHLAGTLTTFRRQGVFTELVKKQIDCVPKGTRVKAVCYPQSIEAMSVLISLNFSITHAGYPIQFEYNQ